ncbi:hypothetical protein Tco_0830060 [Tanacetum coccineum]
MSPPPQSPQRYCGAGSPNPLPPAPGRGIADMSVISRVDLVSSGQLGCSLWDTGGWWGDDVDGKGAPPSSPRDPDVGTEFLSLAVLSSGSGVFVRILWGVVDWEVGKDLMEKEKTSGHYVLVWFWGAISWSSKEAKK